MERKIRSKFESVVFINNFINNKIKNLCETFEDSKINVDLTKKSLKKKVLASIYYGRKF